MKPPLLLAFYFQIFYQRITEKSNWIVNIGDPLCVCGNSVYFFRRSSIVQKTDLFYSQIAQEISKKIISDNPTKLKRKTQSPANEASVLIWARQNKHQVEKINCFNLNTKLQNRQFSTIKKFFRIKEIINYGWSFSISSIRKNFFIVRKLLILQLCIESETVYFFTWCLFYRAQISTDASLAGLEFLRFNFVGIIRNYFLEISWAFWIDFLFSIFHIFRLRGHPHMISQF